MPQLDVMQEYRKIGAMLVISFLLGAIGHIVPYSIHSKLPIDWMLGHMFHIVGSVMVPVIAIPWAFMRIRDRQPRCWWFAVLIGSGLFLYFGMILGIDLMEGNTAGVGSTKVMAMYWSIAATIGMIINYLVFREKDA